MDSNFYTFTVLLGNTLMHKEQGYPSYSNEWTFNCPSEQCKAITLKFPHSLSVPSSGLPWRCENCGSNYTILLSRNDPVPTSSMSSSIAKLQDEVKKSRRENTELNKQLKELMKIITTNHGSTQATLSSIQQAQNELQQRLSQSLTFSTASQSIPETTAMQRAASQPVSSNSVGAAGALGRVIIINNSIPMSRDQSNQSSHSRRRNSGQSANSVLYPFAPRR